MLSKLLQISTSITVYNVLTLGVLFENGKLTETELHKKIIDMGFDFKSHKSKTENSIISMLKYGLIKPIHNEDVEECLYQLTKKGSQIMSEQI